MSLIERRDKPLEEKKPRCPYCGARPCPVFINLVAFGDAPAAIFCCGVCEKILSVAPVAMLPERVEPERKMVIPV